MVGRELQFVKTSIQGISDWRCEVDKKLSETASDLSSMNSDLSSMSKKIDLLLRLQMSGTRSPAPGSIDVGGLPTSAHGDTSKETMNDQTISDGPQVMKSGERTCSASGVSHETRFVDTATCDASGYPQH